MNKSNTVLRKEIAKIILDEIKIYGGQGMIDDDASLVSNKIVDRLSINIQKENNE